MTRSSRCATLHQASAEPAETEVLRRAQDVFAVADRKAKGELEVPLKPTSADGCSTCSTDTVKPINAQASGRARRPVRQRAVRGDSPPALIDFTPYSASAGVGRRGGRGRLRCAWGGADPGLIERWATLQEWPQTLLQAMLFRLAVHAMHPMSTSDSFPGSGRAPHQLIALL